MTVKELIKELQKVDSRRDIYVRDPDGWLNDIECAKVENFGDVVIETFRN